MSVLIDADRWEELLEHRTGVFLGARSGHVASAVKRRMAQHGIDSDQEYWELLHGPDAGLEWSMLVDELVVKDTRFFRHRASFEFVRSHILKRLAANSAMRDYSIWSLGCSTGEEAWSLAMVANDCSKNSDGQMRFSVLGTDVSIRAVSECRKGVYGAQQLAQMTPDERTLYFSQVGRHRRVVDELRSRVAFNVGNVIELSSEGLKYDLIFCQNLLVYFRKWRRRRVLDAMVSRLKPDGLLIIGPGEMTKWNHPQLEYVGQGEVAAYQKIK